MRVLPEKGAAGIDWNEQWRQARERSSRRHRQREYWNGRAPSFAKHASKSDYSKRFLELIDPQPHWTVLDVGCGAGTLALPLATRVKGVTAIDISDGMIDQLKRRCMEQGLCNVRPMVAGWEDPWESSGIEVHDVAIASRSLVVHDLSEAIRKLNSWARRRVYISAVVGEGAHDRRILHAVGRNLPQGPDYIYVCNYLHQIGIYAQVTFVANGPHRMYTSHEDAFQNLRWMVDEITPEEEGRLCAFLEKDLVAQAGQWALSHARPIRWAIIWWEKDDFSPQR